LLGVELHSYPEGEDEEGADQALEEMADKLRLQGAKPYVIHLGPGHPPLGALGYIEAAAEFLDQVENTEHKINEIIVPSGSAATHAGLLFGLKAMSSSIHVNGVCVRRKATLQRVRVLDVLGRLAQLLDISSPVDEKDVHVFDGTLEPGYGRMSEAIREAMALAAQTEALVLDPVYSGKTLAGMIAMIRQGNFDNDSNIMFWHTGGQPALFAYGERILKD
jgi:1-aminocyclopropane-1-carboxylate deaminase/D-cysteine desulfhydrase-like pyridoxal-dependent ACC family enzyme